MLVEASLFAFLSVCFEFADEVLEKAQHGSLATFRRFIPAILKTFRRLLLLGSARRCLLASSLCCHAASISASTPGPTHQPRALRGRLKRGASSAAVESMISAMAVAMSLMKVPSGIGGSAATIELNGNSLGRMGLTRASWCCAGGVCKLDVNTCHRRT